MFRIRAILVASSFMLLLTLTSAQANAQITFSSVTHNFNEVVEGQTDAYGVKLTNGSTTAFPFSLKLTGSSSFTFADNCGSSVPAGNVCEIVFTFAPTAASTVTATWALTANGQTFSPSNGGTLTGIGVSSPGFTVTNSTHDFNTELVGMKTAAFGVTFYNSTDDILNLTIPTTPTNYKSFPIAGTNCGATLQPGASCDLAWYFAPQATGYLSARYTVTAVDATTGQTVILSSPQKTNITYIQLEGNGSSSTGVTLTSAGHYFGEQGVKTLSAKYGTLLVNATSSPLSLTYSGSSTSFPLEGNQCGAQVAAYTACEIEFAFDPQTAGGLEFSYGITATSDGSPVTITSGGKTVTGLTLSGYGLTGTLSVSSSSNNFGPWVKNTTSTAYLTTLKNTTGVAVNLTYAYASGSSTADFPLTEDTCGATLLSGASCNLQWTFSPLTTGSLSATYGIAAIDAATGGQLSVTYGTGTITGVSLSGTGEATAGVSISSASNNFGEQGVGGVSSTFSVTMYNTYSSAVSFSYAYSDPSAAKNFTITADTCGAQLAANSSCSITWEFTPKSAGHTSVVYDITATLGEEPVTILSGTTAESGITLTGTGVN